MQSLLEVERSSAGGAAGDVISSQKPSAALSELSSVSQLLRDSESKCNEARRMARETDVEKQEVEHRLAQKAMAWESESRSLTSRSRISKLRCSHFVPKVTLAPRRARM